MCSWAVAAYVALLCVGASVVATSRDVTAVLHGSSTMVTAIHASNSFSQGQRSSGTRQLVGLSSAPTAAGEVQLGSRAPGLRMSWLRHKSFKKHSRPHLQVYDSRQLQPQATAADVHSALHLQPPNNTWAPATPMPDSAVVPLQEGMLAAAVVHPAASTEAAKLFGIVHQWWLPQPGLTSALNSSKPLQAGCGPLTVEKVAAAAVNYTVMLMLSDYSTPPDLLHHWLGNVEAANIGYYLIASTDDATDEHLTAHGVSSRCYRLAETQHRSTSEGYHWSSDSWRAATWRKVPAAQELLAMGYNVIMSDIDVMWLADPLPFMLNQTEADFMISLDAHYTAAAVHDTGLEPGFSLGRLMNTGVYFARAKIQVLELFQQWMSYQHAHNHDQEGFKLLSAAAGGPVIPVPGDNRLGRVFGGRIVMGQLPVTRFMHSYSYSVMQLHKQMNTTPFEVHMVFGYSHKESKVYRLRDAGLSHDAPDSEYYNPPGGLLSFDLVPPLAPEGFNEWGSKDLSHDEDEMEILHNRAVDYQLQQLYHALGLALALNRTLLMPEMLCFCARGWYPNDVCRLAGDYRTQLPFRCTGDQVFDLDALMRPNISVAGTRLRVRPPSFVTDNHLPSKYRDSKLTITPVEPRCGPTVRHPIWRRLTAVSAVSGTGTACVMQPEQQHDDLHKVVDVPRGHTGETMAQLLNQYSAIPWLHFTNVTAVFSGWGQQANQQAFGILLKSITAEWCCRSADRVAAAGVPDGHVHRIRPCGSPQRFCAARMGNGNPWDRMHSYFC